MPKAPRSKSKSTTSSAHTPSVKPLKRKFAAQDNSVEHVAVGSLADTPANDILHDISSQHDSEQSHLKKKEKQAMKRDAFLTRLGSSSSSSHPYSKSHARRLKRKAREQVAGGLSEIQDVLGELEQSAGMNETIAQSLGREIRARNEKTDMQTDTNGAKSGGDEQRGTRATTRAGLIGQGKSAPLSKAQRRKALHTERLRHSLILSHPEYSKNPFETIRTHAVNTLVKHQP